MLTSIDLKFLFSLSDPWPIYSGFCSLAYILQIAVIILHPAVLGMFLGPSLAISCS